MTFEDHFSAHADAYARFRPRYPPSLFAWLARLAPAHDLAWDAGTGNGQVAVALADHFDQVIGTDASGDQLARAARHERVAYRQERTDQASLDDDSADLIVAGAAAHWFELDGFYREVRRVGRASSVLALFSYGPRELADAIDPIVHDFQDVVLRGFWPERIQYVYDRYRTLPFPFEEIEAPRFATTAEWSLAGALAFLETWSASQRYFETHGTRATDVIAADLARAWGDPGAIRRFEIELFLRVGRAPGPGSSPYNQSKS